MNRALYFENLLGLVGRRASSHRRLLSDLFTLKFLWDPRFPTDEDRAKNGMYLRELYSDGIRIYEDPCSVLEVPIYMAQKISYIVSDPATDQTAFIFWDMMDNMKLTPLDDRHYDENVMYTIVARWMSRDISYNGAGGPFPLRNPSKNQQLVPIWDQAAEYMSENYNDI